MAFWAAVAMAAASETLGVQAYSWQEPHAKVLPNGNLEWAPRPFVFEKGVSARYIDFESGDDTRDGKTTQTAWKHHPWDVHATDEAKSCKGIQTYVFKGGVVYRGALQATESGVPGDPIRLTRDPSWGRGEATLSGAFQIKGGWKKASAEEAPGIPKPELVWYQDIGKKKASALWQVDGDKVERMQIARFPNYDGSDPDDPVKGWPVWTAYDFNTGRFTSPALKGLGDTNMLDGATLWTEGGFLMAAASMCGYQNGSYDPVAGSVIAVGRARADQYTKIPNYALVHFMFENSAKLLDAPGEYYYEAQGARAGRLYLLPFDGVDPNRVVFELAQIPFLISLGGQHDIVVSGLCFRHNDPGYPEPGSDMNKQDWVKINSGGPCISILGSGANITVKNCGFTCVAGAISASLRQTGGGSHQDGPPAGVLDNIMVCDNDIQHVEKAGAIYLAGAGSKGADQGQLKHVEVMRNRLLDTAFRHGTAMWSSHPAIDVHFPETAEVAGNIIDRSLGNGIITWGGKANGSGGTVPLIRILVHHNQLDNTMLNCNDYGGLEHFQGGPTYIYNNVTRNPVGNKVCNKAELAYALYLDGGFKCYSFNNIIAGKFRPDQPGYYNYCGYFMCAGFMDQFFNNTIWHFGLGIKGNSGNRCNILGNLILDCSKSFIGQNNPSDVSMQGGHDTGSGGRVGLPTTAYASNVFCGHPVDFASVAGISSEGSYRGAPIVTSKSLVELRDKLQAANCRLATVGWEVSEMPIADPVHKDYHPTDLSAVQGRGVKYFVPWALGRTVGEWNFYKSAATPQVVLGESFYMTDEYQNRDMYYFLPRMDLTVAACAAENYVTGALEDWIEGALAFDGKDRVATLTHAEMTRSMEYPAGKGKVTFDGAKRETVDMGTNNFLVEIVFKTDAGQTQGTLVSKSAGTGYALAIAPDGGVCLTLQSGNAKVSVSSTVKVNDGQWHHVLAEADRAAGKATIYVDGKAAGAGSLDLLARDAALSNTADFVVGQGFVGAMDFLRICRSTLTESKTSMDELYAWEFNGPFLRDFAGHLPPEGRRDAGAIQGARQTPGETKKQ